MVLTQTKRENRTYRNDLLAYLIAKKKLEIRFALPKNFSIQDHWENPEDMETDISGRSMYHFKRGYFKFEDDSVAAFRGSVNESETGLRYSLDEAEISVSTSSGIEKERFNRTIVQ